MSASMRLQMAAAGAGRFGGEMAGAHVPAGGRRGNRRIRGGARCGDRIRRGAGGAHEIRHGEDAAHEHREESVERVRPWAAMHSGRRCVACSAMTRGGHRGIRGGAPGHRDAGGLDALFGPGIRRVGRVPGRGGQRRAGVDGAGSGSGSQAMAQAAAGDGARIEVRPAGIGFEVIAHCAVVADPWGIVPRMVTGRAHGIWQERL